MKILRIFWFTVFCLIGFGVHAKEVSYTVKEGDTLSKIAAHYHTSVDELVENNSIKNKDLIYPKQQLRITGKKAAEFSQKTLHTETHEIVPPQKGEAGLYTETTKYSCIVGATPIPFCVEKTTLKSEGVGSLEGTSVPASTDSASESPQNSASSGKPLPLALAFGGEPELMTLIDKDARTQRQASVQKFLRTYVGPPHDLPRMEKVLLDSLPVIPTPH